MTVQAAAKGFNVTSGFKSNGFPVCATGTLDFATVQPTATDTIVIGTRTYTFVSSLTAADDILIGADAIATNANTIAAINRGNGEGTLYGTGTVVNADVTAVEGASTDEMDVTARTPGVVGNAIATTSAGVSAPTWGAATLLGGLDGGLWNTPILLGADDGLELKTEAITQDSQLINSDGAIGSRSRGSGDRGNEFHNGDTTFDMKYRGLETIIAVAMGAAAAPVQQSGEAAYLHVFQPGADLFGLMGTLVFDKTVSVWEYPSAKINTITFTQAAGIMEISVGIAASGLNRNEFGGTNNKTTVATITVPTERQFVLFEHLSVFMNSNAGADFAAADEVYVTSFTVTVTNNMKTDDVTTRYNRTIDEAQEDGFFEVTGSLEFSKYQEEKFVDASQTKALQKMKAEWIGPIVPGATTVNARMAMWMPEVQIAVASPNMGGPGLIPFTADFVGARNAAGTDPTGFAAGYGSNALNLELVNGRNTNPILSV